MCVLSLVIFKFCEVRCLIVMYFYTLFSNYSAYVFNAVLCLFLVLCVFFLFVYFVFCIVFVFLCVFLHLCIAVSFLFLYKFTATGWKPNCNK
jgi:hypothetical protein